jgi:hypothetical protein
MDGCNVSDESWRLRFANCEAWLCLLLHNALVTVAPVQLVFHHDGQEMQVFLFDSTTFKQVGKDGKELRAHTCYNLTKGKIEEVIVTDKHTAEGTSMFKVIPKCLYIADAGYGKGSKYYDIVSRGGNALFRFTPNLTKLCNDDNGKDAIDMVKKLKSRKNKRKKIIEFNCFIHVGNGKYTPVRVIASRLPDDKLLLARERKIRTSKKKQTQIKQSTLVYSGWVILMTNLGTEHSAESLLHLYRSRWQIELLFKRIKQFFGVKRLKKATLKHSKVLVLTWMLIWALVERETIATEIMLIEKAVDMELYSLWSLSDLHFRKFETMINSLWAFSLDIKGHIGEIYRRLRNHKSSRINQYALYRLETLKFGSDVSTVDSIVSDGLELAG